MKFLSKILILSLLIFSSCDEEEEGTSIPHFSEGCDPIVNVDDGTLTSCGENCESLSLLYGNPNWDYPSHDCFYSNDLDVIRDIRDMNEVLNDYLLINVGSNQEWSSDGRLISFSWNLYNYDIIILPESIGNLSRLSHLESLNGHLISVPESIGNLTKLTSLNLMGNNLISFPESIRNLTNLEYLKLDSILTTFPESIGDLTKLEELYLINNDFNSIPSNIENLINLRTLDLTHNKLTSLPTEFGNLMNLSSLSLDLNQLTTIPESIENLSSLTYLYLRFNQLTTIPESICNLYLNIYVDGNDLCEEHHYDCIYSWGSQNQYNCCYLDPYGPYGGYNWTTCP